MLFRLVYDAIGSASGGGAEGIGSDPVIEKRPTFARSRGIGRSGRVNLLVDVENTVGSLGCRLLCSSGYNVGVCGKVLDSHRRAIACNTRPYANSFTPTVVPRKFSGDALN